jgi:hypothetical protein
MCRANLPILTVVEFSNNPNMMRPVVSNTQLVPAGSTRSNLEEPSPQHSRGFAKTISVGIGYGWRGEVHKDQRWKTLRDFLSALEQQARKRASQELSRGINEKSPKSITPYDLRPIRIRRLRATVGENSWVSVRRRIRDSDILVFDITPTKSIKATGRPARTSAKVTSSNVWLEIGYAYGQAKTVFLVHAKPRGHRDLASDLQGVIVGCLPVDGAQRDRSLCNRLVSTMRKLVIKRYMASR